jgi:hypothetical protein
MTAVDAARQPDAAALDCATVTSQLIAFARDDADS